VRDSLFIFRSDGGFFVEKRKGKSKSSAAEEHADADAELVPSARAICEFWTGV
jgi:hypothetical protein